MHTRYTQKNQTVSDETMKLTQWEDTYVYIICVSLFWSGEELYDTVFHLAKTRISMYHSRGTMPYRMSKGGFFFGKK